MPDDDAPLGRWLLDRREADGTAVYRPYESFAGRPSRAPRPGLDVRADGTYTWLGGGAGDGHVATGHGRWLRAGGDALALVDDDGRTIRVTLGGEPGTLRVEAAARRDEPV